MNHDEFERIQPLDLDIGNARAPVPEGRAPSQTLPLLALGALVLVAVLVVFLLPRLVTPTAVEVPAAAPAAAAAAAKPGASAPAGGAGTPWEQAQKERERASAKTALDELLAAQFELQERGVEKWAPREFAAATEAAKAGDEHYRNSRFREAEERYRAGTQQLVALRDGIGERLAQRLRDAEAALNKGDGATAQRLYAEALLIDPANSEAQNGNRRAAQIDKVVALMAQASAADAAGNGAEAARLYQETLKLDGAYTPARDALAALQQKETGKRYAALVSSGYAALAAGNAEQARGAFQNALKVRPGAKEARDGLQQASFQLTQGSLSRLVTQAGQAAAREEWQRAVDAWGSALTIDATLASAQQGKREADARLALDKALAHIAAEPKDLGVPKTMDTARRVLAEAERIPAPGPRLRGQIEAARGAIDAWRTKVAVTLQSDNSTDVTVFRVGNLGRFQSKGLELMPGRYVAVGQRSGYRDVRVEFSVEPGQSPSVSVSCRERI